MAVTSKPSAPSRKKSVPVVSIVLGVICIVFAAGSAFFFMQHQEASTKVEHLKNGLIQISAAAESEAVGPEIFDPEVDHAIAIMDLTGDVAALAQGRAEANALAAEQVAEAERVRNERDLVSQQLRDSRSQVDRLQEELEESRSEVARLQEEHADAVNELNTEVERLTRELEVAQSQLEAARAAVEAVDVEETDDVVPEIDPVTDDPDAEPEEGEAEVEGVAPARGSLNLAEGASELFKDAAYDARSERLTLTARDGRQLVYRGVPEEIFEQLENAPVFDVMYRFRVLLNFPSDPEDDVEFIRSIPRR